MWWQRVVGVYHNLFNAKFAIISAAFNGAIAMRISWSHGPKEYLAAGLVGAISGFVSTGITSRLVQHFSPIKSAFVSYFFSSLVPATLTFLAYFIGHQVNGTLELRDSVIAPTAISYTTSYVTNFLARHGYMLPGNYQQKEKN